MHRPFNELLQYYAMERFLYRLSQSPYQDRFVLKGALMLIMWRAPVTRPTMDIDLLGRMDNSPEAVARAIREVCVLQVEPDGLRFNPSTARAQAITQDAGYEGVRIRFRCYLGNARVPMQVDVGFGDVVVGPASETEYPRILDMPAPRLRSYSRESTIAEKLHVMEKRGELNSRMRDFYDVWLLSRQFDFDGERLGEAIRQTFETRRTAIPSRPLAFTEGFASDVTNQHRWRAFLRKSALQNAPETFAGTVADVAAFTSPVLASVSQGRPFRGRWTAPGPWRHTTPGA